MLVLRSTSFLALIAAGSGCDYDQVAALRYADVANNFDPIKMEGLWYEHAYADPAQIGSSCQTLNVTYDQTTGTLDTDFSVKYGSKPFTIVENNVPQAQKAVYRKSVTAPYHIPGGSLIGLKTSIVRADLSVDKSRYDLVVMYSCLLFVNELVIATRNPVIEDSAFTALVKELQARGIPATSSLSRVNRSNCDDAEGPIVV